jgi:hypothetical protein
MQLLRHLSARDVRLKVSHPFFDETRTTPCFFNNTARENEKRKFHSPREATHHLGLRSSVMLGAIGVRRCFFVYSRIVNRKNMEVRMKSAPRLVLTRVVDATPITTFVELILLIILLSAHAYFLLSMIGNGIASTTGETAKPTILDSLYFSIVTISTLGYGDFRPMGWGRFVSSLEVTSGLVLVAIAVSKLASDRTATYVRLLYSSDSERRLKEFQFDISKHVMDLISAKHDHNHELKLESIRSIGLISVNLAKYYAYQTKVGALGEEWARKNSLRVVHAIMRAAEEIGVAGKDQWISATEKSHIDVAFRHIRRAIDTITSNQTSEEFDRARAHIADCIQSYVSYAGSGKTRPAFSEVTPFIANQVKKLLPSKPWPKNIHKEIAAKLRIANRLAHKAITEIESGQHEAKSESTK